MSATVTPILTDVRQYQAHARSSLARDPADNHFHLSDLNLCAELLAKSENLSIWRRPLVRRRLNRLFGRTTVEMCGVHGDFAADPRSSMGVVINRQLNSSRNPEQFAQPDRGTFDAALRTDPDSVEVAALIAPLEQLRDSR